MWVYIILFLCAIFFSAVYLIIKVLFCTICNRYYYLIYYLTRRLFFCKSSIELKNHDRGRHVKYHMLWFAGGGGGSYKGVVVALELRKGKTNVELLSIVWS